MEFGQISWIFVFVSLLGLVLSEQQESHARSTRTLFSSVFGRGNKEQAQQQQPQQQIVEPRDQQQLPAIPYERPFVYQVKYYDTPYVREVNKNNIDKAGEVRQEVQVGQQRVIYYATTNPGVYPGVEQVQQYQPYQQQAQQIVSVPQGYIYVNPVVGGGQPQAYVVSQVGNQQVLVPCPVDYVYQAPAVQEKIVPVPVVKPAVVQPIVQEAIQVKGREQQYNSNRQQQQVQGNQRQPVNVGVVPEVVYNPYGYYGGYGGYGYGYSPYVNPYVNVNTYGYNYGYENPQLVVGVPSAQSQQVQQDRVQGQIPSGVNPYLYYYRGGVTQTAANQGYAPYVYPYVVPVSGVVPNKPHIHPVEGAPSNRVSVSGQGQQVQPQQGQVAQQQQQQTAEAKKGTE